MADAWCDAWIQSFNEDAKVVVIVVGVKGTSPEIQAIMDEDTLLEIATDIKNGLPYDRNKYIIIQINDEKAEGKSKEEIIAEYKALVPAKGQGVYNTLKEEILSQILANKDQFLQIFDYQIKVTSETSTCQSVVVPSILVEVLNQLFGKTTTKYVPYVLNAYFDSRNNDVEFYWEVYTPYNLSTYKVRFD